MEQARLLVEQLKARNLTVCSCESFTAGLFASEIASVSGASAVLKGAIVAYATQIKESVVHIDPELIEREGVISEACAREMAVNTRQLMGADYCVSFTGNAGPTSMEGKPAGLVYCAVAGPDVTHVFSWHSNLGRNLLREDAVSRMIDLLLAWLQKNPS